MASATATAKPEAQPASGSDPEPRDRRRLTWPRASRLGRLIIGLNLLALAILVVGALVLNELRSGLINARIDSLSTQGELIANIIERAATQGEPEPTLDVAAANDILQSFFSGHSQRARLYDGEGRLLADSYLVEDRVEWKVLPPARKSGDNGFRLSLQDKDAKPRALERAKAEFEQEIERARMGETVKQVRLAENGERVVSVSIPIQHVRAVLGVLTVEAGDVDEIIGAERKALLPFVLVAVGAVLISSLLLHRLVAQPVLRMARAADHVRLEGARAISLPDISRRNDEIGDLSRSLEEMTEALSERMGAIERFAADVAHEIKNPLTSIRSAIETLDLVTEAKARQRLLAILQQDVGRLDRLVTDISNASRLDAELSRESPKAIDLARLLTEAVSIYEAQVRGEEPPFSVRVRLVGTPSGAARVMAREIPVSQVFRNLIDNARSFSAAAGEVRVGLVRQNGRLVATVEDDGPGIPPDNLETIFERFYTSRPKGRAFGGNSGLGLSIARQIVEAHGGRIHAENRQDAAGQVTGARFVVELPEHRDGHAHGHHGRDGHHHHGSRE